MREITIIESTSTKLGSCNACTVFTTKDGVVPHVVWQVTLRSLSFRVCVECKKELMEKLKTWK
jgi:hypothetical protein